MGGGRPKAEGDGAGREGEGREGTRGKEGGGSEAIRQVTTSGIDRVINDWITPAWALWP